VSNTWFSGYFWASFVRLLGVNFHSDLAISHLSDQAGRAATRWTGYCNTGSGIDRWPTQIATLHIDFIDSASAIGT